MQGVKRRAGRNRVAIAAALGLLLASLMLLGPMPTAAADVSVHIVNYAFAEQKITVPVGTNVVWTNDDFIPHTVTSDSGVWDSGSLSKGGTFRFTFDTA